MRDFSLISKIAEYNTSFDKSNSPENILVSGSKNVLIDGRQGKVRSRKGYTLYGAGNSALTPVRNGWTWNNSTGKELPLRHYDDELEVYLGTIDGTAVNAWTRITNGWNTTETMRSATWWDATENIDLFLFIIGDANIYEWNGAIAIVDTVPSGTTVKKTGTTTFAQNRFYTTRNKTFYCARTGTEYTYTGGESTTTLTGIADTTGLQAGDILIQKVITQSNKPAASHTNDTLFVFENQVVIGSFDDNEVWISKNNDYTTYTYSSPRVSGEGALLTLDAPSGGFGVAGKYLMAFSGRNSVYKAVYQEITVGTTLAETLTVEKVQLGTDQGSQSPDCIVPIGDSLAYLSYEPAFRVIENPDNLGGANPSTLSNPIKPDFDAEDFTNAKAIWFRNDIFIATPVNSRVYILEFIEDADGKTKRFWQPPQILPIRAFSVIGGILYGHSSVTAETFKLFDGYSDINSGGDKIPFEAIAAYAYRNFGKRALLKWFDEFLVEGEISPASKNVSLTLNYDYGGFTQSITKTIDGTNEDILLETVGGVSLAQASLGQEPLGGSLTAPSDTRKFRAQFELAREDCNELQVVISSNDPDYYWGILALGPNVVLSPDKNTSIKL